MAREQPPPAPPAPTRGTLTITGWLRLADLYPTGGADGDTLPVSVVDTRWQTFHRSAPLRDLDRWIAHGRVRKPVVDRHGRIRVRLLGVDTPELHDRPSLDTRTAAILRKRGVVVPYFRQAGAVRTAERLRVRLADFGPQLLVRVIRQLARPEDGIDTYGRVVAWLILPDGTSLNAWLLAHGLGAPALYDGFGEDDRDVLIAAAHRGRRALAARWTTPHGAFPWARGSGDDAAAGRGGERFVHPKLFRRWSAWAAQRRAGTTRLGFSAWLDGAGERASRLVDGSPVRFGELARVGSRRFAEVVFADAGGRVVHATP